MKHSSAFSGLTVPALLMLATTLGACSSEESAGVADGEITAPAALNAPLELHDPPSGPGALAPNFATGGDGVSLTWLEPTDPERREEFRLLLARFDGTAWSAPVELAAGDSFFANWTDLPATGLPLFHGLFLGLQSSSGYMF